MNTEQVLKEAEQLLNSGSGSMDEGNKELVAGIKAMLVTLDVVTTDEIIMKYVTQGMDDEQAIKKILVPLQMLDPSPKLKKAKHGVSLMLKYTQACIDSTEPVRNVLIARTVVQIIAHTN
jgi:hypothetical protein